LSTIVDKARARQPCAGFAFRAWASSMDDHEPPSAPVSVAPEGEAGGGRNAAQTKLAILAAARRAFAERSYELVGVREVAQLAGVDRALIVRYFGSKEGLFQAALEQALTVEPIIRLDRASFGKEFVELFLSWSGYSAIRMISFAAANPDLRAHSMAQCEKRMIEPLEKWLGPPNAHARATSLLTLFTGLETFWDLGLPSLRSMDPKLRRWLEEASQAIVDDTRE
jgi:AcrR family transcriptional regulator